MSEQWRPQLPAGVIWNHPSIFMPGVERIDAEQLQVQVKLSSVLRGQPVFVWSGTIRWRVRDQVDAYPESCLSAPYPGAALPRRSGTWSISISLRSRFL